MEKQNDFILLPCDVVPPSEMTLASILDRHRATPDAVLTSVLYEPVEAVKDGEEKLLVGLDKETEEVLLIQPLEGLEEDLELRMSLITSYVSLMIVKAQELILIRHPNLSLTTRLLDAHIYVLRRTILDLLMTRRSKDLDSMREQVIPWLIKGGWQKGLSERWAPSESVKTPGCEGAHTLRSTESTEKRSICCGSHSFDDKSCAFQYHHIRFIPIDP